jgi:hypothetical protein
MAPWKKQRSKEGSLRGACWQGACFMTLLLFWLAGAATAAGKMPSISMVLPEDADAAHQRIALVFESQLYQRCGAQVERGIGGDIVVGLVVGSGAAEDGYAIGDRPGGGILISGDNHRGLLYGVGKFLRSSTYEDGESNATFIPGDWRGASAPVQPHRGVYWWTHIGPRWRNAQLENIRIDVEEMGLWGANVISGCFPVQGGYEDIPGYSGFDDPKLAGPLLRMETMMTTAKELGLKTSLFIVPNSAYSGAPERIRSTPHQNECGGNHGVMICPSLPEGEQYLLQQWEGILKHFQSIGIDELVFFPYDEGGCGCARCRPWGGNAYLRISKAIGEMAETLYPGVEIALSTWCFDKDPTATNETELLAEALEKDSGWVDYIMPDYRVPGYFPQKMIDHGVPGNLPAINFAEISMEWHGWNNQDRGLSPNPQKVADMWALTKDHYTGGIAPYCEHIYTDADMVMMAQLSWAPDRSAKDILQEYARFEFSGAHTAAVIQTIRENEAGNTANAATLLKSVEAKLTSYQRDGWRWRSLMHRVNETSARAINHGVEPPRNRLGYAQTNDLPTVASSELSKEFHAGKASDGILSFQDEENCWASANEQDIGSWWQTDLGEKRPIGGVQIQFRGFGGRHHFVPKTITFQVSNDGNEWSTALSKSSDVPANNSPYEAKMHTYGINAEGRYARLLFEDGTDDTVDSTKVVELVEVKVMETPEPEVLQAAPPVKRLRVVLPSEGGDQMARIASVFARQVAGRCSAKVTTGGDAPLTVTLTMDPGIGKEGFRISESADGGIEVVGQNELGVLYGLGKLLRTSRYSEDGFSAGSWRGESVPQKPVRGIYFATHFHNYYHDAPIEEIQRYVEDLALWGYNELLVWYDMHHFNGAEDPEAAAFRFRLRGILLAAKRIGMDVSLVVVGNEAYGNSPEGIRAVPGGGRGGYYPCAVCPSKPEGMQYILKVLGEEFDWAADLKPRSIWIWPYDQGGCGCTECQPWGSKGFMKCLEEVGKLAREKIPGTEIVMSSWMVEENEWLGIREQLKQDKELAEAIVSEPGPAGIVINPEDLGLPLIGFPEISMHETFPWGGFGATPLTARARSQWDAVKATHVGGFPYSEGIYEDFTKAAYSQLYWNDRPVEDTVKEYIAFEFSPEVVEDVAEVIQTLEGNHHWRWWPSKLEGVKLAMDWFPSRGAKPQEDPGAEEAYATMQRVDGLLSPQARKAWRWRHLYLRALLDAELKANGGEPTDRAKQAFEELIDIYHAQNAEPHVRPPLPRKKLNPKAKEQLRSTQVELPGQEHNAIKTSWPGMGTWFWTAKEFERDGYKPFIDLYAKHTNFRLSMTSIRQNVWVDAS